jgi:hypothetical protein
MTADARGQRKPTTHSIRNIRAAAISARCRKRTGAMPAERRGQARASRTEAREADSIIAGKVLSGRFVR